MGEEEMRDENRLRPPQVGIGGHHRGSGAPRLVGQDPQKSVQTLLDVLSPLVW